MYSAPLARCCNYAAFLRHILKRKKTPFGHVKQLGGAHGGASKDASPNSRLDVVLHSAVKVVLIRQCELSYQLSRPPPPRRMLPGPVRMRKCSIDHTDTNWSLRDR